MRGQVVYPEGKTVLAGSVYPEMFVTAVKLPTVTLSAGLHTAVETTTHRSATLIIINYQVHTRLVNAWCYITTFNSLFEFNNYIV